jgi:hypothetical protein
MKQYLVVLTAVLRTAVLLCVPITAIAGGEVQQAADRGGEVTQPVNVADDDNWDNYKADDDNWDNRSLDSSGYKLDDEQVSLWVMFQTISQTIRVILL